MDEDGGRVGRDQFQVVIVMNTGYADGAQSYGKGDQRYEGEGRGNLEDRSQQDREIGEGQEQDVALHRSSSAQPHHQVSFARSAIRGSVLKLIYVQDRSYQQGDRDGGDGRLPGQRTSLHIVRAQSHQQAEVQTDEELPYASVG
jgi:hypothetical protein